MAKGRDIIRGALTFRLNKLSPGEAEDADLFTRCLDALNDVVDEIDGVKAQLFREILTAGTVSGSSGTIGSTWAGLNPGCDILGATAQYPGGTDYPMDALTMAQYADIPLKTTVGLPKLYAHDGYATVYFYPVPSGQTVTLRTRADFADFADLDTDYGMPKGYKSAFSALLAERMAPTLIGGITPAIALEAQRARTRMRSIAVDPKIIDTSAATSNRTAGNILSGWR